MFNLIKIAFTLSLLMATPLLHASDKTIPSASIDANTGN